MNELAQVLDAFFNATQCEAGVWIQTRPNDAAPTRVAATANAPMPSSFPPAADGGKIVPTPNGDVLIAGVPGFAGGEQAARRGLPLAHVQRPTSAFIASCNFFFRWSRSICSRRWK